LIFVGIQPPQEKVFYLLVVMLMVLATRWLAMQGEPLLGMILAFLTFVVICNFVTDGFSYLPDTVGLLTLSASLGVLGFCALFRSTKHYHGPPSLKLLHKVNA
jgi:hypothetical protein